MGKRVVMTGNETVAEAVRQINPDVIAAYPITPSTAVVEYISQYIADGLIDTEFVTAESEHSALSACIGAAVGGGRVVNATSGQGLALMWEMLYIASAMRLPIILAVINRALSGPINIHGDHSDTMGARDCGWIQLYSEDCQEVYDNILQAVRISEHIDVRIPVIVALDGFITSHAIETLETEGDEDVRRFIGDYIPLNSILDIKNIVTYGAIDFQDYYFEHKRHQLEGLHKSAEVIKSVGKEFGKTFGREYGFFEGYRLDDAEYAIVVMNSAGGTVKTVIDDLRDKGRKVGLLKLRIFRPFPAIGIAEALKTKKVVAVLDRTSSAGAQGGPLFNEIRSALYNEPTRPKAVNYIYGLGGKDLTAEHIRGVYEALERIDKSRKIDRLVDYLNLRE
ncbi:MAG: pyruvate ferredoxin oxidoreductase [Nitrospinae bacterium]|nr:pyruvate ferredoxin oxidoreductase [Nitrospinota bacterium]